MARHRHVMASTTIESDDAAMEMARLEAKLKTIGSDLALDYLTCSVDEMYSKTSMSCDT
jgi:hypothetical protein